jgi:hypothetical protein
MMQTPTFPIPFLKPWTFALFLLFFSGKMLLAQPIYRPCRVSFVTKQGIIDCAKGDFRAWSCQVWEGEVLPSNLAKPDAVKKDGYWFIPWEELDCHAEAGLQPYFAGDFGMRGPSGILAVNAQGDSLFAHSSTASDWIFDSEPSKGYPGLPLLIPFRKGCWSLESLLPVEELLQAHHRLYRPILIAADHLPVPEYQDRVVVVEALGKRFQAGEKVQVAVLGTFYDGGTSLPFFSVQRREGDEWVTVHEFCCEELDDAMHVWLRRDEIMDLFVWGSGTQGASADGLPILETVPGLYRLIMYDRYMRAGVSEAFEVE